MQLLHQKVNHNFQSFFNIENWKDKYWNSSVLISNWEFSKYVANNLSMIINYAYVAQYFTHYFAVKFDRNSNINVLLP